MHVESVAWIAERKDVLSTFFMLLTLAAYTGYVHRPSVYRYVAALVFFVLGLMAKPVVVTLPFALLLLDFWPLGRIRLGHTQPTAQYGARQTGKSTAAGQLIDRLGWPAHYAAADTPLPPGPEWMSISPEISRARSLMLRRPWPS